MTSNQERNPAKAGFPRSEGALELWTGVECTVNRVGDRYLDQCELNGHAVRESDIGLLAGLGASRLRFPVLWERVAPEEHGPRFWSWSDTRLAAARDLGVRPIVGLVHHGSGPRHTSLVDPAFPEKLAAYAREVAVRYPWVDAWTPVNEPLTTARFSGLYGHWYPHERSGAGLWRTLLSELRGTVLAMRAVREVNPSAQLVQTEDLGRVHSTPRLRGQADFENLRRWLSFDLLTGRVDEGHELWGYLRWIGADERDLAWFMEHPCPPDVLGINVYITSERFLDERLGRYPAETHGGNDEVRYADVEAVRVLGRPLGLFSERLRETWERYRLPIAITEAHLGCTREEQLRWLAQAWEAAQQARAEGVDVRAVTPWAAFGSFDWNSLLTRFEGHYEPGLWDVRAPEPRPTALVTLARELAAGQTPTNPVLNSPGWWERRERVHYPPEGEVEGRTPRGAPLLITGATGTLGRAFARLCEVRGLPYRLLSRQDMDLTDEASVAGALDRWQPWAVVNTAGYVRVDDAEHDERNTRDNADGPAVLAHACSARGVRLVTFSSDLVFDGAKGHAYVESDPTRPLNAYGRAKADAETRVLSRCPDALVVRTAAFFGPWDEYNFVTLALRELRAGRTLRAAEDQRVTPTYVPDLVHATLDLLIDGERGVWHLANEGPDGRAVSWADLARMAARLAGLDETLVQGVPGRLLGQTAPRPHDVGLSSERGLVMPPLEDALRRHLDATPLAVTSRDVETHPDERRTPVHLTSEFGGKPRNDLPHGGSPEQPAAASRAPRRDP